MRYHGWRGRFTRGRDLSLQIHAWFLNARLYFGQTGLASYRALTCIVGLRVGFIVPIDLLR